MQTSFAGAKGQDAVHLEEIYEVCQSVTVLRDGEVVANSPLAEMPKERLVSVMGALPLRSDAAHALPVSGPDLHGHLDLDEARIAVRDRPRWR